MNLILQAIKSLFRKLEAKIPKKLSDLVNDLNISTPDWNQNNPKGEGYIKNRPFYEERIDVVWVAEQNFIIDENGQATIIRRDGINWPWNHPFEVIFDGISYKGVVYEDSEMLIHTDFTTKDGYEVTIYDGVGVCTSPNLAGEHTIKIIYTNVITHKIDEKYFPGKMNATNPVGTGSFSMNRKAGTTVGDYSHAEGQHNTASGYCSHAEGYYTTASGGNAHAEGRYTTARGIHSHAEGENTTASGDYAHAEGGNTTASGDYAHAEGYNTTASGDYAHAEGRINTASNYGSHAEGYNTTASGGYAHTEGYGTTASGYCSHAEGSGTAARSYYSHAEGINTTAASSRQHVQGMYNVVDNAGKYAHIVGNGESGKNSNAHTLDWKGVGWYQGGLQVGGNAQDDGAKNVLLEGDAIPVPETASIGQTLAVKSVDENGKPTEWEVIDAPKNIPTDGGIAVTGATVGQTVKISEVDENGVPTAWEPADFPSGGDGKKWVYHFSATLTEPVADVQVSMPEKYTEVYACIKATFSSKPFVNAEGTAVDGAVDAGWVNGMGLTSEPLMLNVSMGQWTGAWGWVMGSPITLPSGVDTSMNEKRPYIGFCGQLGSGSDNQPKAIHMHANKRWLHMADIRFVPRNSLLFNTGLTFDVWCR